MYGHRQAQGVLPSVGEETAIFDNYEFNQSAGRPLHRVHDLAFSGDLRWSGPGVLRIRCPLMESAFELQIEMNVRGEPASVEVWIGGALASKTDVVLTSAQDGYARILIGYWDRRIMGRLGERVVMQFAPEDELAVTEVDNRFAIAAEGFKNLEVTNLAIWRDLYYFIPPDSKLASDEQGRCQLATLSPGSYLLLGDNVPSSKDARMGPRQGTATEDQILGVVVPVR